MKRVAIDTNVLVSALLFGGRPGTLVALWKRGAIRPAASAAIVEEYLKVLAYPRFNLSEQEIDYLISVEVLPWFDIVKASRGKSFVAADPGDDKFIWCALASGADAIISGDEHLLALAGPPVPILTVSRFLRLIERDAGAETT
jgi:putative PIN family toxin of toxin-antitoxin system